MDKSNVFVKINLKNIGEVRSLIVDKAGLGKYYNDKYLMCAGKYDHVNGWTIVFKAKDYKEAQYIIDNTPIKARTNVTRYNKYIC